MAIICHNSQSYSPRPAQSGPFRLRSTCTRATQTHTRLNRPNTGGSMQLIEFEMDEDQIRRLVALIINEYLHNLNRYNSHHVAVESVQDETLDRICKHGYIELESYTGTMH